MDLAFDQRHAPVSLDLRSHGVDDDGAAYLADRLSDSSSRVTALDISFNNLGSSGSRRLAGGLVGGCLDSLNLSYNMVGPCGIREVARVLGTGDCKLTSLSIGGNTIGDAGAVLLGECLENGAKLRCLDISHNSVEAAGAKRLARSIQTNRVLTALDMGSNVVGDAGARCLGECLSAGCALVSLNLSLNNICCDGADALASGLAGNFSLTSLDLSLNRIEKRGSDLLTAALQANTTLLGLLIDLRGDQVDALLERNRAVAQRCLVLTVRAEGRSGGPPPPQHGEVWRLSFTTMAGREVLALDVGPRESLASLQPALSRAAGASSQCLRLSLPCGQLLAAHDETPVSRLGIEVRQRVAGQNTAGGDDLAPKRQRLS